MSAVLALAGQFVRLAIRDRLLAAIPFFLVALALLAPLVSRLALGGPDKAVRDVGLWLLWLLASLMAVIVGVRAIGGDLRDGSAALWLSRPISRAAYVLGRFLGALGLLGLVTAGLVASFGAVALWQGAMPATGLPWYGLLLWIELALVASWAMLLSSLMAPVPAALATAGLWAAGHLADEYARLAASGDAPLVQVVFRIVFVVVPDLDLFDVQDRVVHQIPVDAGAAAWACGYGLFWIAGLLALTAIAMTRRDVA